MCFLITSFHSQEIFNIGCYHAKSDSTVVLDKKLTSPRSLFASGYITDSMVLYPKSHWFYRMHIFLILLKMSVDVFFSQNMSCLCSHSGLGWVDLYHSIPFNWTFSQSMHQEKRTHRSSNEML